MPTNAIVPFRRTGTRYPMSPALMAVVLTNPDVLADYVNWFFGADGPYPTP